MNASSASRASHSTPDQSTRRYLRHLMRRRPFPADKIAASILLDVGGLKALQGPPTDRARREDLPRRRWPARLDERQAANRSRKGSALVARERDATNITGERPMTTMSKSRSTRPAIRLALRDRKRTWIS